jgi:hypothetical protein
MTANADAMGTAATPPASTATPEPLAAALARLARLLEQLPLFDVFLELGVNQQTQTALIGIGLSRTSTIAVSEFITADSLGESQVLQWLEKDGDLWSHSALPALVKREIDRVLEQHKVRA